ncbi:uncharacterized protein LOC110858244 isoform X1 [Folsomia candida]|uniref:uncharacterized protein LOC110858244 isoform X1 n=2 Tax=Folsomia candida TaxID=158441 RepID=UPI000B8F8630|nr:uncharacterized protein LOC110858244 isoform X1 [Folsomia candida]
MNSGVSRKGYKRIWEEARHPPRTLLTVRRKFIILMVRSQLNDVSNPAIAPQGSPAWVRQLHELVFQHDNEVSHGDIKRWIKNHTWIANTANDHIPGMQSFWDCVNNRVTQLGTMSHSFPREFLNTLDLPNVGNHNIEVTKEGVNCLIDNPGVELLSEGQNHNHHNSQRIEDNVENRDRGPTILGRNVYCRGQSQPPVLIPYYDQPFVQYDDDAEAPLNLTMYPPIQQETGTNLQLRDDEQRRLEQQDRELGQDDQGQEQLQPVDMSMNADQHQDNAISSNNTLPSGQGDTPASPNAVPAISQPKDSSPLHRLEEIFESVLALANLCNALDEIHEIQPETKQTLQHIYRVVARKHAREVIRFPYEVLRAREQRRIKEEAFEASTREGGTDSTPLRGLGRYKQRAEVVVVNLMTPPRRPTPDAFLTSKHGEPTPVEVLQVD